jgi:xanthine dehydrogenase accessory factor
MTDQPTACALPATPGGPADAATTDLNAIAPLALAWRTAGRALALATVVETWGSSPRPVGSQLVVDAAGAFAGSVSGGCVEGAVIEAAQAAIAAGRPALLRFGVSNEQAWAVGLACGGTISVQVRPLALDRDSPDPGFLAAITQARATRRGGALVTDLADGRSAFVHDSGRSEGTLPLPEPARSAALAALAADRSGVVDLEAARLFVQVFAPPLRLAIVGAVHLAEPLAPMAAMCGFDVVVMDPRQGFATAFRHPGVGIDTRWPDAAMAAFAPDARAAIVTLTHDPKLDDAALSVALTSPAFYVGSLGSKKTHAARCARLQAAGLPESAIARLHAPVGLDIGAKSPAEIAVSILAEIIQVRRQGGSARGLPAAA